ncbi:hypothetical protein AMTRI_Chr09g12810 [Amborella trichopoda]
MDFSFQNGRHGSTHSYHDSDLEGNGVRDLDKRFMAVPSNSSAIMSSSGVNYIEHHISKMDTLAGVAIKYGVEVADIKRMNGLVTDLQMFAHKSLQIPLPGRHPPSPIVSNGSNSLSNGTGGPTQQRRPKAGHSSDVAELVQSLKLKFPQQRRVSPAMSSLQGYYGLSLSKANSNYTNNEGMEMATYKTGSSSRGKSLEDEPQSLPFDFPVNKHRKSRSLINGFLPESNGLLPEDVPMSGAGDSESERSGEKSVRRRQKTESTLVGDAPPSKVSPAPRRNRASSSNLRDGDGAHVNALPFGDSFMADGFGAVRKSSSTSNLQDQDNVSPLRLGGPKRALKPDFQSLSAATIARPIFDGLPKPMGWRSKAALD